MSGPGSTQQVVAAVDIGGTGITGGLLDGDRVLLRTTTPTRAAAGSDAALHAVLGALSELVTAAPAGAEIAGMGVVTPGTVDEDSGMVIDAENLGWHHLPLREIVQHEFGLPVGFGHDVRAGGLAEWRYGAGMATATGNTANAGTADAAENGDSMVFLPIGTGIAAALMLDGRLLVSGGYAGEVGHGGPRARLDSSPGAGLPCPCGGTGCSETFASAAGMARRYQALTGTEVDGAADVLSRRASGDPVAATVWSDAVTEIAAIVSDLVRVTGVPRVIVGGGLVGTGDELLDPLRDGVRAALTVHRAPQIVPAQLGADAGLYGAGLIGWQAVRAA